MFVTSSSRVPLGGFTQLQGSSGIQPFQIHKVRMLRVRRSRSEIANISWRVSAVSRERPTQRGHLLQRVALTVLPELRGPEAQASDRDLGGSGPLRACMTKRLPTRLRESTHDTHCNASQHVFNDLMTICCCTLPPLYSAYASYDKRERKP